MKKEDFIEKIKKEIPSTQQENIEMQSEFIELFNLFSLPYEKIQEKIYHAIEQGIMMIQNKNPLAPRYFLIMSELPFIDQKIRDFCIDTMLFAEGDMYGEFKSIDEIFNKFNKIKTRK